MNERIKELRKALGLTQQDFAERIGVKRNTIAQYEIGRNPPIDAVITSICREFNVSEAWLRGGTGGMFIERTRNEELSAFFGEVLSADDFRARLFSVMSRLSTEEWAILEKMAHQLVEEEQKKPAL